MNARFFFSYPNAETPPCFATSWILPTKLYEFNENFPNDIGTQHLTWKSWKWGPSFDWLLGCASFSTRVARDRPATTDRNWKDPLVCRCFMEDKSCWIPSPKWSNWFEVLCSRTYLISLMFFFSKKQTWHLLLLLHKQLDVVEWYWYYYYFLFRLTLDLDQFWPVKSAFNAGHAGTLCRDWKSQECHEHLLKS